MAGRNFLFVPGPTNVPDRVLRAMTVADGRPPLADLPRTDPRLPERLEAGVQDRRPAPRSSFPSSGTGCWEAALTNCLNAGRQSADRRASGSSATCGRHVHAAGLRGRSARNAWGEGAPIDRYLASLSADKQHKIKAVSGVPERDRHRRHQRRRRHSSGDGQRQASGAAVRRLRERARQHRFSHG